MGVLQVRRRGQNWISYLLLAAGVALMGYVLAQYGAMFSEQRRLARKWERQNAASVASRNSHDGLIRLTIPRINLDAVVVEGTGRKQLLLGPGHVQQSASPGEAGNTVITAHRDTFFRHLYELNQGDVIELRRDGAVYRYEVSWKKVVDPSDVSVMDPTPDARLTLITCYPTYYIGPAPERLVVSSRLLDNAALPRSAERSPAAP